MLETPQTNRRNQLIAATSAVVIGGGCVVAALNQSPLWWIGIPAAAGLYFWIRRGTVRRLAVLAKPFPESWRSILLQHVAFYGSLSAAEKQKFENRMKVFLDEVAITGIKTEVDEETRVLVAASAMIPIQGFSDWDYSGLGEVLIYPDNFNSEYNSVEATDRNILGMVGSRHLSGVMIFSKPSLLAGFDNPSDKRNVGIHEFAHLVDKQGGGIDGVPVTVPADIYDPWVKFVGNELRGNGQHAADIDEYAYTNEAEYFAVLSEYFFENPAQLESQHPKLYKMLRKMYHQDTKQLFSRRRKRRRKVGRNDPCPCGSGEKYKKCCNAAS